MPETSPLPPLFVAYSAAKRFILLYRTRDHIAVEGCILMIAFQGKKESVYMEDNPIKWVRVECKYFKGKPGKNI